MEKKYKLEKYHYLMNIFNNDEDKTTYPSNEEEDDLVYYFKLANPLYIGVLINYLYMIIPKICSEKKKDDSISLIKDIKNHPEKYDNKFSYKDITLSKLFDGNYEFLKSIFVINWDVILNEESFLTNFCLEDAELSYSFSIKEFYDEILNRIIDNIINDFYLKEKKNYI